MGLIIFHFLVLINAFLSLEILLLLTPQCDENVSTYPNSNLREIFRTKWYHKNWRVSLNYFFFSIESRVARIYNVVASTKYLSSMIFYFKLKVFLKILHTNNRSTTESREIRSCIAQKLKLYSLSFLQLTFWASVALLDKALKVSAKLWTIFRNFKIMPKFVISFQDQNCTTLS